MDSRDIQIESDRELAIRLQLRDNGVNNELINRCIMQDRIRRHREQEIATSNTSQERTRGLNNRRNIMNMFRILCGRTQPDRLSTENRGLSFDQNDNNTNTGRRTIVDNLFGGSMFDNNFFTNSTPSLDIGSFSRPTNTTHTNSDAHSLSNDYDNLATDFINRSTNPTPVNQHVSRTITGRTNRTGHRSFPNEFFRAMSGEISGQNRLYTYTYSLWNDIENLPSNASMFGLFFPNIINLINPQRSQDDVPIVLDDKDIDKIKNNSISYNDIIKKDSDKIDIECPICMDPLKNDNNDVKNIIKLPCYHVFHDKCIIKLFTGYGYKCPVCRFVCGKPKAKLS